MFDGTCLQEQGNTLKSLRATEKFEDFRDYKGSQLKVTIGLVQQEALKVAHGRVPHPLKQIQLMNKKKEKGSRGHHASIISLAFCFSFFVRGFGESKCCCWFVVGWDS